MSETNRKKYTTNDIKIGSAEYIVKTKNYRFHGDNSAALEFQNKCFICFQYVYLEERRLQSNGKYVYEKTFEDELREPFKGYKNLENKIIDGSREDHYYGYAYNVLDCFNQFLNDLEDNCTFMAVRGGEESMEILQAVMDPSIPEWCISLYSRGMQRSSKPFTDYRKAKLIQQVNDTCKRKNITLNLSPWYKEIVSKTKIDEWKYNKVKRFEGDLELWKAEKYHFVYADGYEEDRVFDDFIKNLG